MEDPSRPAETSDRTLLIWLLVAVCVLGLGGLLVCGGYVAYLLHDPRPAPAPPPPVGPDGLTDEEREGAKRLDDAEKVGIRFIEAFFYARDEEALSLTTDGFRDRVSPTALAAMRREQEERFGEFVELSPSKVAEHAPGRPVPTTILTLRAIHDSGGGVRVRVALHPGPGDGWLVDEIDLADEVDRDRKTGRERRVETAARKQTCRQCGSTRRREPGEPWASWFDAPGAADCDHVWRVGVKRTVSEPVESGVVVLVRVAGDYGAFVLRNQREGPPEVTDYDFYYRDDGGTSLDPSDPAVERGSVETKRVVEFGPFRIRWSIARANLGWLYYSVLPGDPMPANGVRICVTESRNMEGLDAGDERWVYRAFRGDPGR